MNDKELLELKNKVDKARSSLSELAGQKTYLMEELKTKWNCNNLKEAEILKQKIEKTLEELTDTINKKREELREYGI